MDYFWIFLLAFIIVYLIMGQDAAVYVVRKNEFGPIAAYYAMHIFIMVAWLPLLGLLLVLNTLGKLD